MTEQQNDLAPDDADVEGHRMRPGHTVQPDTQDDDVEGHRLANRAPLGSEDDDDVEGHRMRPGHTVQPDHDDEDVAGHWRAY